MVADVGAFSDGALPAGWQAGVSLLSSSIMQCVAVCCSVLQCVSFVI